MLQHWLPGHAARLGCALTTTDCCLQDKSRRSMQGFHTRSVIAPAMRTRGLGSSQEELYLIQSWSPAYRVSCLWHPHLELRQRGSFPASAGVLEYCMRLELCVLAEALDGSQYETSSLLVRCMAGVQAVQG